MQERVVRVQERLSAVDREVAAFVTATGLACPPGCGACCLSPEVESSPVELAPMAAALVDAGRADETLAALAAAPVPGPCVLYRPDASDPRRGRCSAYATRPLLCRLFGFGARRTRAGRTELVACRTMRAADPERVAAAAGNELLLAHAPLMADHVHAVAAEAPGDGARLVPINLALREALERELFLRGLVAQDAGTAPDGGDGEGDDDGAPEPPLVAA